MDLLNILLKIEDDDFSYEVNDLLEEVRHFTLFSYARKGQLWKKETIFQSYHNFYHIPK